MKQKKREASYPKARREWTAIYRTARMVEQTGLSRALEECILTADAKFPWWINIPMWAAKRYWLFVRALEALNDKRYKPKVL